MVFWTFILGTIALFLQAVLAKPFVLLSYAPWLGLVVLKTNAPFSFYLAFCAGAVVDLLSDDPMGVHALNYVIVVAIVSRYRSYFLEEHPWHLGILTWAISLISTLLQVFLLFLFDRRIPFAGQWALGDLMVMPLADALYALLWFRIPLSIYRYGRLYWLNIKKKLFLTTR